MKYAGKDFIVVLIWASRNKTQAIKNKISIERKCARMIQNKSRVVSKQRAISWL